MTTDTPQLIEPLTRREEEVLERLRRGLTNRQIARDLDISPDGVKFHVSGILGKLGVRSRHEAAYWPEPAPCWAGGLAPLMFWWRRTVPAVGPKLSTTTNVIAGGVLVAAVAGLALLAFLVFRSRDSAEPVDVLLLEPQVALAQAVANTRNADSYRMSIEQVGESVGAETQQVFQMTYESPDRYHAFSRDMTTRESCSTGSVIAAVDGTPYPQTTREEVCVEITPEPDERRLFEVVITGAEGLGRACVDVQQDCDPWNGGPLDQPWEPVTLGIDPMQGPAWPLGVAENLKLASYKGLERVDGAMLQRFHGFADAYGTAYTLLAQSYDDLGTPFHTSCQAEEECVEMSFAEYRNSDEFEMPSFPSFIDVFVDPATQLIRRIDILAFPMFGFSAEPVIAVEYSDYGNVTVELPQ